MSDEPLTPDDTASAVESIDALLDQVDSGDIDATPAERAYLAGSRDALRRPDTRKHDGTPWPGSRPIDQRDP